MRDKPVYNLICDRKNIILNIQKIQQILEYRIYLLINTCTLVHWQSTVANVRLVSPHSYIHVFGIIRFSVVRCIAYVREYIYINDYCLGNIYIHTRERERDIESLIRFFSARDVVLILDFSKTLIRICARLREPQHVLRIYANPYIMTHIVYLLLIVLFAGFRYGEEFLSPSSTRLPFCSWTSTVCGNWSCSSASSSPSWR